LPFKHRQSTLAIEKRTGIKPIERNNQVHLLQFGKDM
jgi:hypothetical protein